MRSPEAKAFPAHVCKNASVWPPQAFFQLKLLREETSWSAAFFLSWPFHVTLDQMFFLADDVASSFYGVGLARDAFINEESTNAKLGASQNRLLRLRLWGMLLMSSFQLATLDLMMSFSPLAMHFKVSSCRFSTVFKVPGEQPGNGKEGHNFFLSTKTGLEAIAFCGFSTSAQCICRVFPNFAISKRQDSLALGQPKKARREEVARRYLVTETSFARSLTSAALASTPRKMFWCATASQSLTSTHEGIFQA